MRLGWQAVATSVGGDTTLMVAVHWPLEEAPVGDAELKGILALVTGVRPVGDGASGRVELGDTAVSGLALARERDGVMAGILAG